MADVIRKVGNDLVVRLPGNVVEQLGWTSGDILDFQTDDAGIRLVRVKTKHDRAMQIADEIMDEYREVFETLAKS